MVPDSDELISLFLKHLNKLICRIHTCVMRSDILVGFVADGDINVSARVSKTSLVFDHHT